MILPRTKDSLSLAFSGALLFCCIVLYRLLIYAKETLGAMHCYEMILVHTLDIVLGNKEKLVPRFYH